MDTDFINALNRIFRLKSVLGKEMPACQKAVWATRNQILNKAPSSPASEKGARAPAGQRALSAPAEARSAVALSGAHFEPGMTAGPVMPTPGPPRSEDRVGSGSYAWHPITDSSLPPAKPSGMPEFFPTAGDSRVPGQLSGVGVPWSGGFRGTD